MCTVLRKGYITKFFLLETFYIYFTYLEIYFERPTAQDFQPLVCFYQVIPFTGWGGESWTSFCGPAAVAVGGCERKD
jgi:hypothetical protein